MGLQRETASRGTLAIYSKIVFATMLERIVFHTLPTFLSVVGTLMIVASALYIVVCSLSLHSTCNTSSLTNTYSWQKRKPRQKLTNSVVFLYRTTRSWSKALRRRAVELEDLNIKIWYISGTLSCLEREIVVCIAC
jgi:hypothetical protein